jgi:hypothetical protein
VAHLRESAVVDGRASAEADFKAGSPSGRCRDPENRLPIGQDAVQALKGFSKRNRPPAAVAQTGSQNTAVSESASSKPGPTITRWWDQAKR